MDAPERPPAPAIHADPPPQTTRRTTLIVAAVLLALVVGVALHLTGIVGPG